MTKFMCLHTVPGKSMTLDQIRQFARAAQQAREVRGYRSFANLSEGKVACIMEADSKEVLAAWFTRMGMPVDTIIPLEYEGERGSVRDVMHEPATA